MPPLPGFLAKNCHLGLFWDIWVLCWWILYNATLGVDKFLSSKWKNCCSSQVCDSLEATRMLTKEARLYSSSFVPKTVGSLAAHVCTHTLPGVGPSDYRPGRFWLYEFLSPEAPSQGLLLFSRAPHFLCARQNQTATWEPHCLVERGMSASQQPHIQVLASPHSQPHPTA